jgi:hypothetical protein
MHHQIAVLKPIIVAEVPEVPSKSIQQSHVLLEILLNL